MIIVIILGLALGSFMNALVWRLKRKMDFVKERSVCEHCGHTLAWNDLIPLISWISLGGKCRYCQKPISLQNPLAELLMAASFGLSYAFWPQTITTLSQWTIFGLWLGILALLIGLLLYDINWYELPDSLMKVVAVLVVISLIFSVVDADNQTEIIRDSTFGFLIGGGLFYLLYQFSDGKWIGGGDVKLGFVMGLYVGALNSLIALLIGFYSATLFILPLIAVKKLNRKSKVPFGPFLIIGFIAVTLWGNELSDALKNLLGIANL